MPLLCLVGLLVWPAVIGLSRGYRRTRIGIGFDEFRAVLRAGVVDGRGLRATGWTPGRPDRGADSSDLALASRFTRYSSWLRSARRLRSFSA